MKRIFLYFLVFLFLTRFPFITGCANMIPPTGGPRDSLAPVLIDAQPTLNALNVTTKKIVLNFDEYLDLKDVRQNLIVSPVPKISPSVSAHLKTITIEIKDTLQPNTTYALNFGKSVTDVNEGNVLNNFTYVFSTGKYLDSMTYGGSVILAKTGKPDSTLIAMLYDQMDDSAVAKQKPRYIAHVDSSGNFSFKYLKPSIYRLYALKDESGTHEYTSPYQTFAFADSPVDLRKHSPPLLLYAFADTGTEKRPSKMVAPPAPSKKEEKEKVKRLVVGINLPDGRLDLHEQLTLRFDHPLINYDSSKISFSKDSFQTISNYQLLMDSTHKKITVSYSYTEDTKYQLILQKDFAEDSLGDKLLKIDTINFKTKKEADYGNLRLRFKSLDLERHPVLFFTQGEKVYLSAPIGRSLRYNNKLFEPGDYEMHILYDTNQNGVWDPGDFYKHRQPEIVVPVRKKLTVKANWDNEVDITL